MLFTLVMSSDNLFHKSSERGKKSVDVMMFSPAERRWRWNGLTCCGMEEFWQQLGHQERKLIALQS